MYANNGVVAINHGIKAIAWVVTIGQMLTMGCRLNKGCISDMGCSVTMYFKR